MVYRVFVEKKEGLDNEAKGLLNEARNLLGIAGLENIRLFNRYDAENITKELFDYAVKTVFSEPQLDNTSDQFPGRAASDPYCQGLWPVWQAQRWGYRRLQEACDQCGGKPGGRAFLA